MSDVNAVVARIKDVQFRPVRIREGYGMAEVDDLLDECEDAVRGGRPMSPLIEAARFQRVKWREGYDIAEVDAFLAALRAADPA